MLPSGRHRTLALALGAPAFAIFLMAGIATVFGVRINTSYSLPLGLYATTNEPTAELIEFCPAEPFASESASRSYRTRGFACPDGAVPLLKPIVARPGDLVFVSPEGITVNGRLLRRTQPASEDVSGRPLKSWPTGLYGVGPDTVWVASTYNVGSYDSRYMGPIHTSQIRRRLRPLWLLRG
ncbi:MAG: conjugative transfer signal peptidase TraF [Bryobacterales bacterium]|nr:conjugative transfer signal peptidase TraF [Bryobacterales bacterium]